MKYKQKRYLSINFLFHTHKNSVGDFQLLVRIRMGRENSFSMPIGIKIKKKLWDWKTELISAKHPNAKIYNKKIVELKNRSAEAIALFQTSTDDKPFGFLSVCNYMQGKQDITSLDTYVDTYIKTSTDEAAYTNTSERLRYFKQQINLKGDLYFEDVNNVLFTKYRKIVDKKIKDKEGSTTTYKAYLSTVLSICKEAYDNEHVDKEVRISDKNKKFKKFDYGENPIFTK